MGLDLAAYSNVTVLPVDPEREIDGENAIRVFAYAGFERSTRGLADHDVLSSDGRMIARREYDITASGSLYWSAGSYIGYGRFRESLAEIAGRPASDYRPDSDGTAPFYELVWFADNEGAIGHEAAADLLADFQEYRARYHSEHADSQWADTYDEWIVGLTLAADHGLVHFG